MVFAWPANARLALTLGARPEGARSYEHAFALARGIMVEAIVSFHMGAGLARAQGSPSPAADFVAAAAGLYMKGRKGLQAAVAHEHARMVILGKWRRRAGCKRLAVDSPRQNWEERWLGSGAARDPNGHITQRVLATHFDRVPLPMSLEARRLGAVRWDWTPTLPLPPATTVLYVSNDEHLSDACHRAARAGWGVAALTQSGTQQWTVNGAPALPEGVFGAPEASATLSASFGGCVTVDSERPAYVGAESLSGVSAALTGVIEALKWCSTCPPGPTLVRINNDTAAMTLAGIADASACVYAASDDKAWPASLGENRLATAAARAWRAERERCGGRLWLLVSPPGQGLPWAERAEALASYGARGVLIDGDKWHVPHNTPIGVALSHGGTAHGVTNVCSVCYCDFSDVLPSPDPLSRAPPGRFGTDSQRCCHAACRKCDAILQLMHAGGCPVCRAPRIASARLP